VVADAVSTRYAISEPMAGIPIGGVLQVHGIGNQALVQGPGRRGANPVSK
jgi:hypothetical protein